MEVLQRTSNRGSISTGYDIDNSLKLESDNSEELYQTLGTPTSTKIMTFSFWIKRSELAATNDYIIGTDQQTASPFNTFRIFFEGDTQFSVQNYSATVQNTRLVTADYYRDTSAWYHFVAAIDTTQATASNRMKLYINGVQKTDWTSGIETQPGLNEDIYLESGRVLRIGSWKDDNGTTYYAGGKYLSEVHFVDGQQLAASDFGEFDTDTGIWKPIEYTGSYGNNGFYLDFESSGSLGADSSGNSNNFTLSNITSADQATDTPTNNFCTLTSVANFYWEPKSENATNGGTTVTDSSVTNNWTGTMATTPLFTGKWYWEVYMFQPSEQMVGIHDFSGNVGSTTGTPHPYQLGRSWTVYGGGANWIKSIYGTDTTGTSETAFSNNTIVGVALDLDNHVLTFYENGGSAGTNLTSIDISSLTNTYPGPWMPFVGVFRNKLQANFGGFSGFTISSGNTDENGYGNFEYAPPSGFLAICSKNLAGS